jgi:hypothetical protein
MENLGVYERGILKEVLQKEWSENLAQGGVQWRALLEAVINLRVP